MVVLNFFCAQSSALKLLAFLCLLFLSRVIFPFVWYIASVRLYFEIFVSATTYVVWWCGLLLLFCSWFTFLIVIIEKKAKQESESFLWHDEVNNKWAKILQSRSVYTIFYTKSALLSTNCMWNLRLCPDMNWSPKIYKIVRGERMEEEVLLLLRKNSKLPLHNKVCLHWISTLSTPGILFQTL